MGLQLKRYPDKTVDPFFRLGGIPDEQQLFDCGGNRNSIAQNDNARTVCLPDISREVAWHCPSILADENTAGVSGDFKYFGIG